MVAGMTSKAKIAVTLPTDLVAAARSAVKAGRAPSVSAYVGALKERTKLDDLDALLDEMLAETGGPLTDAERAEIDRQAGWK